MFPTHILLDLKDALDDFDRDMHTIETVQYNHYDILMIVLEIISYRHLGIRALTMEEYLNYITLSLEDYLHCGNWRHADVDAYMQALIQLTLKLTSRINQLYPNPHTQPFEYYLDTIGFDGTLLFNHVREYND